jgi:undecaprenyl diphosphate synthase
MTPAPPPAGSLADHVKHAKQLMDKAVEAVKREFTTVRTGKATTALLDLVRVEAYGNEMPLTQVASVAAPEPKLLTVQPWDKGLLKAVEKGILASDLGLTPSNDGNLIRIPIPPLTEERRKELVKVVPDQEDRARFVRRPEARREGSAKDARRPPQGGGRGGEGQRSGDYGSLMLTGPIPRHVAIIMDGNGRWASERRLPRPFGHRAGMKAVREAVEGAIDAGVEVLTLFAFSEENWNRPATEISALMDLLEEYIAKEVAELKGQGVRVHVLGDRARLTAGGGAAVERVERETAGGQKLSLNLCISYSSRGEIARAARLLAEEVLKGTKKLEDIDEEAIRAKLYTAPWGDPDLLIRTSGEQRLSNFLLWQLAYTELYITPVLWPDFNRRTLVDAILDYQRRDRRFGKVTAS